MPWAQIQDCADVDEVRSVTGPVVSEYFAASGGPFHVRLVSVALHCLRLDCATETLPRSLFLEMHDRVGIGFSASNNFPMKHQGAELLANEISMMSPGGTLWHTTTGPGDWFTMALPEDDFAEAGSTLVGRDIMACTPSLVARVAPSSLARLQSLYAAAVRAAESAPEIIAHPAAARALETTLIEAMLECLAQGDMRYDSASRRRHATIIGRLGQLEEANRGRPLFLADVCRSLRVSQRSLHQICQEYLGVGPKRYLLLRRLRLAYRELETASRSETTVTEVATKYGFWELGRFAVAYRETFGESPSATLAR